MYQNNQTISQTGLLSQGGSPASTSSINADGTLNNPSVSYSPTLQGMLIPAASKPDAGWVNVNAAQAKADAQYAAANNMQASQLAISQQQAATPPPAPSGGKIICKQYHNLGILSDELNVLDQAYGAWLMKTNPAWQKSYWRYARHLVKHLHRDHWANRLLITCLTPFVRVWSQEMGYRMGGNYKHSVLGSFYMWGMVKIFVTLGSFRNFRLRFTRLFTRKSKVISV